MEAKRVGRPKGADIENSKRRRKQLMDAAVSSIVEHGVSSTTLATVARASGLSQGTAVFYFKTKEMLLTETFRHRMEEYRSTWMAAIAAAGDDAVDRIIAMTFASLAPNLLTHDNLAFWNAVWPEAARSTSLNAVFNTLDTERQEMISELCEDAASVLQGTLWTPDAAAQAIETMVEGIWARLYYSAEHLKIEEARMTAGRLLASIFPDSRDNIMEFATSSETRET